MTSPSTKTSLLSVKGTRLSSSQMLIPAGPRERLSERMRQNWSAQHPNETSTTGGEMIDDSLTSLAWLQNLSVMKVNASASTTARHSTAYCFSPGSGTISKITDCRSTPAAKRLNENVPPLILIKKQSMQQKSVDRVSHGEVEPPRRSVDPNDILEVANAKWKSDVTMSSSLVGMQCVVSADEIPAVNHEVCGTQDSSAIVCEDEEEEEMTNYKTNPLIKPPYSYATLICMAMQVSPTKRSTLTDIYSWITNNFAYYAVADPVWQNSVRHNLSLHKCFRKIPRRTDEPGKGSFWMINPEHKNFVDRNLLKRHLPTDFYCAPPPTKRSRGGSLEKTKAIDAVTRLSSPDTSVNVTVFTAEIVATKHASDWTSDLAIDSFTNNTFNDKMSPVLNRDINIGSSEVGKNTSHNKDNNNNNAVMSNDVSIFGSPISMDDDLFNFDNFLHQTNVDSVVIGESLDESERVDLTVQGVGLRPPPGWCDEVSEYFKAVDGESYVYQDTHPQDAFSHSWIGTGENFNDALLQSLDIDIDIFRNELGVF